MCKNGCIDNRFGFNGKENDSEWGSQVIQDYGFRIYNPSIGKFLSVDPLVKDYPWYTPYQFAGNTPIKFIDIDGLEPTDPQLKWDYRPELQKKHWGDLYGIYLYKTMGIHSEDPYFKGASEMYVVERHDRNYDHADTGADDLTIGYEYYDKHAKKWIPFDPNDVANPDEVKSIATNALLFSGGAVAMAPLLKPTWSYFGSFSINLSWEVGESLVFDRSLNEIDYFDAFNPLARTSIFTNALIDYKAETGFMTNDFGSAGIEIGAGILGKKVSNYYKGKASNFLEKSKNLSNYRFEVFNYKNRYGKTESSIITTVMKAKWDRKIGEDLLKTGRRRGTALSIGVEHGVKGLRNMISQRLRGGDETE